MSHIQYTDQNMSQFMEDYVFTGIIYNISATSWVNKKVKFIHNLVVYLAQMIDLLWAGRKELGCVFAGHWKR